MAFQEQAIREQQSAMMATIQQQLQAMSLPPEQQQEYLKQNQDLYGLQLQQIQQQSDLVERGQMQRRVVRVEFTSPLFTLPCRVRSLTTCKFQDILYLMIVDMPSDAEMAVARKQLNDAGQVQPTNDMKFATVDV